MLAAQRTAKRCRRRDTFHFDVRNVENVSTGSPTNSCISGEGGSIMHSNMPAMLEILHEDDEATGVTDPLGEETNGEFGGTAKKIRRHGALQQYFMSF